MVPSPKKTRTSPVKKVSARRSRTASSSSFSSILSDSEISSVNKSWANVTEDDEDMRSELIKSASKSDSRRKGAYPKKANTRPKFVRSLELSEAIMSNGRRSERIRERDKVSSDSNRFGHKETVVKTVMESRKRHLSSASTCTFTGDDEGCSPIKRTTEKGYAISSGRPARKTQREEAPVGKTPSRNRRLFGKKTAASPSGEFDPKDFWEEPTLGWCKDQATLDRRTKELERAKEKPVYARYLEEMPRHMRIKGVHPRTPNKHINFSRRSWDSQVRSWKRSLYDWAGEDPSDSVNTSFCSYSSEEIKNDDQENLNKPVLASIRELDDIKVRPETDAMASLLGHFDLDSRRGDESTLKAPDTDSVRTNGPVDFSNMNA